MNWPKSQTLAPVQSILEPDLYVDWCFAGLDYLAKNNVRTMRPASAMTAFLASTETEEPV